MCKMQACHAGRLQPGAGYGIHTLCACFPVYTCRLLLFYILYYVANQVLWFLCITDFSCSLKGYTTPVTKCVKYDTSGLLKTPWIPPEMEQFFKLFCNYFAPLNLHLLQNFSSPTSQKLLLIFGNEMSYWQLAVGNSWNQIQWFLKHS